MLTPLTKKQTKKLENIYYKQRRMVGRDKLFYLLKQDPENDISRRQVADWLSKQETHQLFTNRPEKSSTIKPTILKKPYSQLAIDLVDMTAYEDNGLKWLLNVVDMFSKRAWSKSLPDKTDKSVSKAMSEILNSIKENVSTIRSDNGSEFKNAMFSRMLKNAGVKRHIFSLPYKPQSNGAIERFNQTLKRQIFQNKHIDSQYSWSKDLINLIERYNNEYHDTIKMSPNKLLESKDWKTAETNTRRRIKDWGIENAIYDVGQKVRILADEDRDEKWSKDIYKIVKVFEPKNSVAVPQYQLQNEDGNRINKLYYRDELQPIDGVMNKIKQEQKYRISRLVRPLYKDKQPAYEVKWVGYNEPTFEPRENLMKSIPKIVRAFERDFEVEWKPKLKWKIPKK